MTSPPPLVPLHSAAAGEPAAARFDREIVEAADKLRDPESHQKIV
jgi:hypothetical protein